MTRAKHSQSSPEPTALPDRIPFARIGDPPELIEAVNADREMLRRQAWRSFALGDDTNPLVNQLLNSELEPIGGEAC